MTAEQVMQDSLSDEEMAKVLGITVGTLWNRISAGKDHPPYIGRGKGRRFPLDEYRKWARSQLIHQKNR